MKIYSRSEFMKLPEGTIFSSGPAYAFSDLYIKGESFPSDFYQSSLVNIDYISSAEYGDRMDYMLQNGTSNAINKSEGREGLFDDTILYLVYEKEDLEYMISMFKKAIEL